MNKTQTQIVTHVRVELWIALFLVIVTLIVYWQVGNHAFVYYDDEVYVTENLKVQSGINAVSMRWALIDTLSGNWHPLTWLSHMLDVELYGMHAGRHHLTNVLFHIVNTLLLFLVLKKMTGDWGKSGFVAALFALHPLNVESVAWVAERKNVLSTFFWMLTLWGYLFYTEHRQKRAYLLVILVFILGLMSKSMLVTLPFVLLLLDFWPLRRWQPEHLDNVADIRREKTGFVDLVLEKIPLFILTAASCIVTLRVERIYSFKLFPLTGRLANALVSYTGYIQKMIWPHNLACFYPYPKMLPPWKVAGAGIVLLVISFWAVHNAIRRPCFFTGWFWYLGTLMPVIGLVQVGPQAMADRYAYVPLIGLFIIVAWGVPDILSARPNKHAFLVMSVFIVLSALMVGSWFQVGRWQNSIILFRHALKATHNNWLAHINLGRALYDQGQLEAAIDQFDKALAIQSNSVPALYNMGKALSDSGKIDQAAKFYQKTLEIKPDYGGAHNNLANILAVKGDFKSAVWHYREALKIDPADADVHNNLANVLAAEGKINESVRHYTEALMIDPGYENAQRNLGNLLFKMEPDQFNRATAYLFKKIGARSQYNLALHRIGAVLAQKGHIDKASRFFSEAIQINPEYVPVPAGS